MKKLTTFKRYKFECFFCTANFYSSREMHLPEAKLEAFHAGWRKVRVEPWATLVWRCPDAQRHDREAFALAHQREEESKNGWNGWEPS